jgi:hypothetical protein
MALTGLLLDKVISMFEMMLKSLGVSPETLKEYIDKFAGKSQEYEQRLIALETKIDSICAALNIPLSGLSAQIQLSRTSGITTPRRRRSCRLVERHEYPTQL